MNYDEIKRGAGELKSPCYVFDSERFQTRVRKIQTLLGSRAEVCYAMKANPFLIGEAEGLKIEVCSPGEFAICERRGIQPEQVVLSGVNKEAGEIRRVMHLYGDRITYTAESENQFSLLSETAKTEGIRIRVLLRLTAGNQFGMDQETITRIAALAGEHPEIQIRGIQFYSGTQKKKLSRIQKELKMLDEFADGLYEKTGFKAEELEYGPGFYVPYFMDEDAENIEDTLESFCEMLNELRFSGKITLEMGRYLAASCGYYYTTVVDEKKNGDQIYAIADGGIHQLNYYGQMMAMKVPHYHQADREGNLIVTDGSSASEPEQVTLCGSLCTVNDILVRSLALSLPLVGTKVVFENCGAYSVTEGMALFLSRDLPRVYIYKEDAFRMVRDRLESNLWNSAGNES